MMYDKKNYHCLYRRKGRARNIIHHLTSFLFWVPTFPSSLMSVWLFINLITFITYIDDVVVLRCVGEGGGVFGPGAHLRWPTPLETYPALDFQGFFR